MTKQIVFILFSLAVTAGVMGYLLTRVPLSEVWVTIISMDAFGLWCFIGLSFTMSYLRSWRYVVLLGVSGFTPKRISLFLIILVRNLFSDLLPARIGTAIYIYLVNSRLGIPLSAATSSFATAFIFDILVLAPMVLVAAVLIGGGSEINSASIILIAFILALMCAALYRYLPVLFRFIARLIRKIRLPQARWNTHLSKLALEIADETRRYQCAGILGRLLLLSLGIRIAKYASLYILLYAMLAPLGYALPDFEVPAVFIGLVIPELAASLPISGIAGFGAYEGAWVLIFTLLGFPLELSEITALAHHGFTQVYGYTLGLVALLILWFGLRPTTTIKK